jgi:hypothetical protein
MGLARSSPVKTIRAASVLPLNSEGVSEPQGKFPGLKSSDRAPHEVILHRAYAIWESEGHPDNRKLANWLEAEVEVMGPALQPGPESDPARHA